MEYEDYNDGMPSYQAPVGEVNFTGNRIADGMLSLIPFAGTLNAGINMGLDHRLNHLTRKEMLLRNLPNVLANMGIDIATMGIGKVPGLIKKAKVLKPLEKVVKEGVEKVASSTVGKVAKGAYKKVANSSAGAVIKKADAGLQTAKKKLYNSYLDARKAAAKEGKALRYEAYKKEYEKKLTKEMYGAEATADKYRSAYVAREASRLGRQPNSKELKKIFNDANEGWDALQELKKTFKLPQPSYNKAGELITELDKLPSSRWKLPMVEGWQGVRNTFNLFKQSPQHKALAAQFSGLGPVGSRLAAYGVRAVPLATSQLRYAPVTRGINDVNEQELAKLPIEDLQKAVNDPRITGDTFRAYAQALQIAEENARMDRYRQ